MKCLNPLLIKVKTKVSEAISNIEIASTIRNQYLKTRHNIIDFIKNLSYTNE